LFVNASGCRAERLPRLKCHGRRGKRSEFLLNMLFDADQCGGWTAHRHRSLMQEAPACQQCYIDASTIAPRWLLRRV
jgi:hypothetical protein